MKNPLDYLSLWQKKRNELPVDTSLEQDWVKMRSVLDKQLPSVPKASGSHGGLGAGGLKALSVLIVAVSAAVAVYHFENISETKHKYHTKKPDSPKNYVGRRDSISSSSNNDPLKMPSRADTSQDNLYKQDNSLQSKTSVAKRGDTRSNGKLAGAVKNTNPGKRGSAVSAQQDSAAKLSRTGKIIAAHSGVSSRNFVAPFGNGKRKAKGSNGYVPGLRQVESKAGADHKKPVVPSAAALSADDPTAKNNNTAGSSKNATATPGNAVDSVNRPEKEIKSAKTVNADKKQKKGRAANTTSQSPSRFDFGLLTGVNSSGSFTPKKQNANFYGSLPADIYFGLFGTYTIKNKLGVNIQLKVLNPQNISGSYAHANGSKADSNQTLMVTDSRKAYFVSIPVHGVYKINDHIGIKAGPVINVPVKQINATTTLLPANVKTDSAYYASVTGQLKNTRYQQKINFGLSGGVSVTYKRLFLEAVYSKGVSGYNVSSGFGSYKYNAGNVQVTIGFSLKKAKKK